jgi:hypothetical protein
VTFKDASSSTGKSIPQIDVENDEVKMRVSVDKIKITTYFKGATQEYLQFIAHKWSVLHKDFGSGGVVHKSHPLSSLTTHHQKLSAGGTLLVRHGRSHGKHFGTVEFNPGKCSMSELCGHFDLLFNNGYASLLERGIVTYCEFAIDVDHVLFGDYMYLDRRLATGFSGYNALGTEYLGSSRSPRHLIAYDKRKQLLDKSKVDLGYNKLRIEAKVSGANRFPFNELSCVENPFASLLVLRRDKFQKCNADLIKQLRHSMEVFDDSLQRAYASLAPKQKGQVATLLEPMMPCWWQPKSIWPKLHQNLGWTIPG